MTFLTFWRQNDYLKKVTDKLIDDKNDQQFPSLSQRYDNLTSL